MTVHAFNVRADTSPETIRSMRTLGDTPDSILGVHTAAWYDAIARWEPWVKAATASPHTLRLRVYHVTRVGRELAAIAPPQTITAQDLIGWFADQDWAPNTRRSYRSSLRAFFGWLQSSGERTDDPAFKIPRPPVPRSVPRPAPPQVVDGAVDAMTVLDPKVALAIRLGAECGLRRAEIAGVHSDHVEQHNGTWWLRVPTTSAKGGHVRMLPLVDPDLARAIRARNGWLWPNRDNPDTHVSPHWVGKKVSAALRDQTDIGTWTTHTLRHRYATATYGATRDIRAVQTLLGHASPETTQVYTFIPDTDLIAAAMGASRSATS